MDLIKKFMKNNNSNISPKKIEKLITKRKNKLKTTLGWLPIEEVNEYGIKLKVDNEIYWCRGIRIYPENIFLLESKDKNEIINNIALAYNQMKFTWYYKTIFKVPDLDVQNNRLIKKMESETDPSILYLEQIFLDSHINFIENYGEIQFFFVVVEKEKYIDHIEDELYRHMLKSPLKISKMKFQDYKNLIAYDFDNNTINEAYFNVVLNPNKDKRG